YFFTKKNRINLFFSQSVPLFDGHDLCLEELCATILVDFGIQMRQADSKIFSQVCLSVRVEFHNAFEKRFVHSVPPFCVFLGHHQNTTGWVSCQDIFSCFSEKICYHYDTGRVRNDDRRKNKGTVARKLKL